jgi:alpha-tubulin suppressor-like RCC1 family protein
LRHPWLLVLLTAGCAEYNFQGTGTDTVVVVDDTEDTPDTDSDVPVEETGWGDTATCSGGIEGATGTWAAVDAGDAFTCALTSTGEIRCWGADNCGQVSKVPDGDGWVDITAGGCHACAVDCNDRLHCWGLYVGDEAETSTPGGPFIDVDSGLQHACGVRPDGSVRCWGYDGDGSGATDVPAITGTVQQVDAGYATSCVLTDSGDITCWGDEARLTAWSGLTGNDYTTFDIQASNLCALDADRRATCSGPDTHGEITGINRQGAANLVDVSSGGDFICVVQGSGWLQCWGDDTYSQLLPPSGGGHVSVVTGVHHGCALTDAGDLRCWGRNDSGQIDVPTP